MMVMPSITGDGESCARQPPTARAPTRTKGKRTLRARIGTAKTFDTLNRATCAEADAREFYGMRITELGDWFTARSRVIVRETGPDFVTGSA